MKEKNLLLLLILFLILNCAYQAAPIFQRQVSTSKISDQLGDIVYHTIKNSEKMEVSRSKETVSSNKVILSGNDQTWIKHLLLDEGNYLWDVKKRAVFVPTYSIDITHDNSIVQLIFSTSARQMRFVTADKQYTVDCDPMSAELKRILSKSTQLKP